MTIDNINLHSYPGSEKTYMQGQIHPDVRVGMRRVILTPTVKVAADGTKTVRENAPVYIYDTSGVYTDPEVTVDINRGLPRIREAWNARRDVRQPPPAPAGQGRAPDHPDGPRTQRDHHS